MVRKDSIGRPLHENGRLMSKAEAEKREAQEVKEANKSRVPKWAVVATGAAVVIAAIAIERNSDDGLAVEGADTTATTLAEAKITTTTTFAPEATTATTVPEATTATTVALATEADGFDELARLELAQLLTIDETSVDCDVIAGEFGSVELVEFEEGVEYPLFDIAALKSVGSEYDQRRWSDALSTPLEILDAEANLADQAFDSVLAKICEDPLYGSTMAHMFSNLTVDGLRIADLNPWLADFGGETSEINDNALEFVPHFGEDEAWVLANSHQVIEGYTSYNEVAERLGTLLERFKNEGVHIRRTVENYHLEAGGLVVGDGNLAEVGLNPDQYEGSFLVLNLDEKDGDCLTAVGINTLDGRPVLFTCIPGETTTTTTTVNEGKQASKASTEVLVETSEEPTRAPDPTPESEPESNQSGEGATNTETPTETTEEAVVSDKVEETITGTAAKP